jgi:ACS family hexuronate transporter-like MFS transporter
MIIPINNNSGITTTRYKFRWTVVILLFFATTINYLDRQVLGILAPTLIKTFNWNETDYGLIVSAFQWAYAIGLVSTGYLLDKIGTKKGFSLAISVWSVAGSAHAFCSSLGSFAAARFMLGLGEAGNFPACIKSIAAWFPKKERAFATGHFMFPAKRQPLFCHFNSQTSLINYFLKSITHNAMNFHGTTNYFSG